MVDFRIDVVVDPAASRRGTQEVGRQLDRLEREALELRNALQQALAVRDRGAARALGRIEQVLLRTEQRAAITDARIGQIGRDINDRRLRQFNRTLDDTGRRANDVGRLLRRAFAGFTVAVAIRQFVRLSDEFLRVQNLIRTVVEDQSEVNQQFERLSAIANETRTEVGAIAQLYQRGSIAARELGASQGEMLLFVERVGKSLAVQGISAIKARGALLQLSQALGSGIVRAEEFNSILEGAFPIAQAAARGLEEAGGSVAKLRRLIIEGEVTSREFFEAFLVGSRDIEERFERTSVTIGQSITILNNNLTKAVGQFNKVTGASAGLAAAIGFVGENIPAVAAGMLAIGSSFALVAVRAAASTAAMKSFIASAVPLTAVAVAAGSVASAINSITEEYAAAAATLAQVEADAAAVARGGAQITAAQRELNQINRAIAEQQARGGEASEAQLSRIQSLQESIRTLRGDVLQQAVDQDRAEAAALAAAEAQKAQEEATKRQKELLESIRAPALDYANIQGDLSALLTAGAISQEQFNRRLREAREAFERAQGGRVERDPFAEQRDTLEDINRILSLRLSLGDQAADRLLFEIELRSRIKGITDDQVRALLALFNEQQRLNEEIAKETEERREQERIAAATARRRERLVEQVDVQGQLIEQERELLRLREEEAELVPQIDQALEDLRLRQLEASTDLAAGFERASIKIRREAEDLAAVGESVVNVFADRATDALVEFAETGQFEFREFASAILKDLTRIIARLLIVRALSSVIGGGGASVPVNAGAQFGATVQPGQRPRPVGEGGVELFVPDRTGTIVPNPADVRQPPPEVRLSVINVDDPMMVPSSIDSGNADEAIINVLARNPQKVNRALGNS